MRRLILLTACATLLLPAAIFASGSSRAAIPSGSGGSERPFDVTKNLKCTVIEVHENNLIKVRDDKSGDVHLMQLSQRIPIKAQDKSQFDGRKKLRAEDLREGHRILVTKRTDVDVVVRIKVLKDRKKA